MDEELEICVNEAISNKVFPGCSIGVVRKGGTRQIFSFGRLTYSNDAEKVTEHTVYDCASVTKSIPLACIVMKLIDDGAINLKDSIAKYLPEFATHEDKITVTVRHLLTYTLDIDVPPTSTLASAGAQNIIETILTAPLKKKPGTSFLYANSTALLLGLLIHRVTGKYIDSLGGTYFFEPLGMKYTGFHPLKLSNVSIAPTQENAPVGVVQDEVTHALQGVGYYLGASGLFSNASDLLTFIEMLLEGGEKEGRRFLPFSIVLSFFENQFPESSFQAGLGWQLFEGFGGRCIGDMFGKTGFTGTAVYVNSSKRVGVVILSNRTYPKRSQTDEAIIKFRRRIMEIVCA